MVFFKITVLNIIEKYIIIYNILQCKQNCIVFNNLLLKWRLLIKLHLFVHLFIYLLKDLTLFILYF